MKNKEKYDLNTLKIDSVTCDGKIEYMVVYENVTSDAKKIFEKRYIAQHVYPFQLLVDFANWLEQEYDPEILTKKEKEYLSAVIKPFREKVESIKKFENYYSAQEYIHIAMKKGTDYCSLPWFRKGTMYKGMEAYKLYTLEELGL